MLGEKSGMHTELGSMGSKPSMDVEYGVRLESPIRMEKKKCAESFY